LIADGTYEATASDRLDLIDRATFAVVRKPPYPNAEIDVEDGTNLPKGTKFVLQPQSWPSDLYIPSQAKETENWTRSLIELKQDFQRLQESEPAVSCRLIQMRIPEFPGRDTSEDWFKEREPFMSSMGGGLGKKFCQLGPDRRQPLFGAFAISDVNGKPIGNSAGEAFGFRYGLSRSKFLFRDNGFGSLSSSRSSESIFGESGFMAICKRGAEILYELPASLSTYVWKYWPEGFSREANSDGYLWIDAVFETGWQRARSNEFFVKRFAQSEDLNMKLELKGRGHFPRLSKNCKSKEASQIAHENGFPVQIFSEIENLASHSIALVDSLLVKAAKLELKHAENFEKRVELDEAQRVILRSIELFEIAGSEKDLAIALGYNAMLQQRLGRSRECEVSLRRALEIELRLELYEDALATYSRIAMILEATDRSEQALNLLGEAGQLALSQGQVFKVNELKLMVATIQRESKMPEEALATVNSIFEYLRNNEDKSLRFPATVEAASCLVELQRYRDAIKRLDELFEAATRFDSELYFATARLLHGKILAGQRDYEAAIVSLQLAADLFLQLDEMVHCADAWFQLAKTYFGMGYNSLSQQSAVKSALTFEKLNSERHVEVSSWMNEYLESNMSNEFDVFICHASADKESVVTPIVDACKKIGIRCWFDAHEIKWGEDIASRIAEGLQKSRFVLVVVSEKSRGRGWPLKEIGIAIDSEVKAGDVKVLPLYVGDREALEREFPILANKLGASWNGKPDDIATAIKQRLDGNVDTESKPTTSTAYVPKVGGQITDRDRDRFVQDSFRVIAEYFAEAGRHLEKQQPRIVVEVQKPAAEKLRCTAYLDGNRKAQCQIWIDSTFGSRAINFFNGSSFSGEFGAFNESIRVVETDNGLLLNGTMGGHFGDGIENANATEGAATLWKSFIRRVES